MYLTRVRANIFYYALYIRIFYTNYVEWVNLCFINIDMKKTAKKKNLPSLKDLMSSKLPAKTYQRKMSYRVSKRTVQTLYKIINKEIFNDRLTMPYIAVKSRLQGAWGECIGLEKPFKEGRSRCMITLADRWYCKQWLITALAHEMVHQYQWDICSKGRNRQGLPSIMSHGPTFYCWREKLRKKGIPLKVCNDHERWFVTQHLFKC